MMQQTSFFETEWQEVSAPRHGACIYYSGASPYDAYGLIRAGVAVGVAAPELRRETERLLVDYTRGGGQVFVDSGAFSASRKGREMDFGRAVFPAYKRLLDARAVASNLLLVAPDYVGDQRRTRALLAEHQRAVRRLLARGASVVVPLQKGLLPAAWLWREAVSMFGASGLVAGIPSRDAAFSAEDLRQFVSSAHPARLHMLGLGADKARLVPRLEVLAQLAPDTIVSYDANRIRAHLGAGRRITERSRALVRAEGGWVGAPAAPAPWGKPGAGEVETELDETDLTGSLFLDADWMTDAEIERLATLLGQDAAEMAEAHQDGTLGDYLEERLIDHRQLDWAVATMMQHTSLSVARARTIEEMVASGAL